MYRLLAGMEGSTWTTLLSRKCGCLTQGVKKNRPNAQRIDGTNTILFIPRNNVTV